MMRGALSSLRVRLLLLVLLALIPALGLILYSANEQRRLATADAHEQLLRLARIGVETEADLIEDGRRLLAALAWLSEVRTRDAAACRTVFASVRTQFPGYTDIVAAHPNGDVFCSGSPLRGPVNLGDRPYFRRALDSREFAVGEYVIGRITGQPVLTLAYPSVDTSGAVRAVIALGVHADWLSQFAAHSRLPSGATMSLVDSTGTILARVPDSEPWVGKTVPQSPIIRAMLDRRGEGTTQARGLDGLERLYAFTPLRRTEPLRPGFVRVGIPTGVALAGVHRILVRNLFGLGLIVGVMLVVAWVASDLLILRRVRGLTGAAARLAAGDLSTRAKLGAGRDELSTLATTFDAMADSLETRTQELRRSEQRFAAILDTAADAIISIDAQQQIIRFNHGAETIFGYRASEVVGEPLDRLLPAHLREIHRRHIRDFAAGPETARFMDERREVAGRRKDGTLFPAEASISKVVFAGETTLTVVARDVTERRRTQTALQDSEALFRSTFEDSGIGMALQATDGRYLRVNRALCGMLGYSAEELLATTFQALTHPDDRDADVDHDRRMLASEIRAAPREKRYLHQRGHVVWVLATVSLLRDPQGQPRYFVAQVQDITTRKWAAEHEARLQAQLAQSEKLATLGQLLAGVAHELNNPLAVVVGRAALLARALAGGPLERQMAQIEQAAERCAQIVKNFLALARQQPMERRPVSLNQVVQEAVELLAYPLRVDNVDVRLELAPDLPPIWADPHQLHQVVVNLVSNAHQAMRETASARRVTVTTRADPATAQVRLEVADTGPGIPPDVQRRIFEPFFTTKPPGLGTGLGLSLCQGIVERHGGVIRVESSPGQGAVFVIELPVDLRHEVRPEASPLALPPSTGEKAILIVDDEPEVAEMLADLLRLDGHRVEIVPSGRLALDALRQRPYDLILSDVKMPDLDGPGLYQALERQRPELLSRIAFLSGDRLSPEIHAFLERTRAPSLSKPFTLEEVRQVVQRVGSGP